MHIFIDESGIFSNPQSRNNVPSCVGALIVPSTRKKAVFKEFERIKYRWAKGSGEIKGSQLNEEQVSELVKMLRSYDVLLEITSIDMEGYTAEQISELKKLQAARIMETITPEHHPEVIRQANEIRAAFEAMSNPLFTQSFVLLNLIPRTLHHGILYYARRIPAELQWFYWVIDAKQDYVTEFERAWSTINYGTMSAQSYNQPVSFVEGGDYSYFQRFYEPVSEHLAAEAVLPAEAIQNISLRKIFGERLRFQDSKLNLGLQVVDVLVTAVRRALKGTLSRPGWEDIGSLMINRRIDGSWNGICPIGFMMSEISDNEFIPTLNSEEVYRVFLSRGKSILRPDEF